MLIIVSLAHKVILAASDCHIKMRRNIEFILMVPNREMQSLSVMPVMLNTEVGIDCSITYVNINLLHKVSSPLTNSLYIRK